MFAVISTALSSDVDDCSPNDPTDDDNSPASIIRDELDEETECHLSLEQERELEATLDDNANRLSIGDLDEPIVDESNEEDGNFTKKLGYNHFMIDNVWKVGKKRLMVDNIRMKRKGAVTRAAQKLIVKKA